MGEPATGKSQLIKAVTHPLGLYAKRVADDVALLKPGNSHKANLHALRDARLGMVHEPSDGTQFNVDQLKSLSGGDEQTSNAMRGNWETWLPRLQVLITCNSVPDIGNDAGLKDRLRFIKFDNVIPPADRVEHYAERVLYPEAAGVLNWLIETHRRSIDVPTPAAPAAVLAVGAEIARQQNPVLEFLDDQLEQRLLLNESRIPASRLRKLYNEWFAGRRKRGETLSPRKFNGYMRSLGYESKASNSTQYWLGLAEDVTEV